MWKWFPMKGETGESEQPAIQLNKFNKLSAGPTGDNWIKEELQKVNWNIGRYF